VAYGSPTPRARAPTLQTASGVVLPTFPFLARSLGLSAAHGRGVPSLPRQTLPCTPYGASSFSYTQLWGCVFMAASRKVPTAVGIFHTATRSRRVPCSPVCLARGTGVGWGGDIRTLYHSSRKSPTPPYPDGYSLPSLPLLPHGRVAAGVSLLVALPSTVRLLLNLLMGPGAPRRCLPSSFSEG